MFGTRFVATRECPTHDNVKRWMMGAAETDTTVIQRSIGSNSRVIKNAASAQAAELEARNAPLEELLTVISGDKARELLLEGTMNSGPFACGEVVGLIPDIPTVQELVERTIAEAVAVRRKLAEL